MTEAKEGENKEQTYQYNELTGEYASLAELDPSKRFVQFPEALRMLGEVKEKKILDIGCGTGTFARMLARRGAKVVGYDPAGTQVQEAQRIEGQEKLGIEYSVSDRPPVVSEKFDEAVSVLVLPYATDSNNLREIFGYAGQSLAEKGLFVSITFNPNYKRFGEAAYNRRFTKTADGRIQVDFLNDDESTKMSAKFSDFSASDYENAAKQAGFGNVEWVKLGVTPEGIKEKGEKFWEGYEDDCPYIGIKAIK